MESWKKAMVAVDPALESYLTSQHPIFKESFELFDTTRKSILQANREKQAQKASPQATKAELQGIINEKLDAQSRARRESIELTQIYNELGAPSWKKALSHAGDVMGLTRALESSMDVSATFRQSKAAIMRHPILWAKAYGKQLKALNTKEYERLLSAIELDPDYKYATRYKLDLTGLEGREEGFESGIARKIPGVKHTEQAYSTMLNYVRMGWFKQYMNNLRRLGLDPDNPADVKHFQSGATLVNNATGRGDLGRNAAGKKLRQLSGAFNQVLFSPRFWVSRLALLSIPFDPRSYFTPGVLKAVAIDAVTLGKAKRKPSGNEARVEAWKTIASFTALVGTQLALASLAGMKVGLDPEDPDFLKASYGDYHIDFSAGLQGNIRAFLRVYKAAKNPPKSSKEGQSAGAILTDFTRKKLAPNAHIFADMILDKQSKGFGSDWRGEDFLKRPKYMFGKPGAGLNRINPLSEHGSIVIQKLLPMMVDDVKELVYDDAKDARGSLDFSRFKADKGTLPAFGAMIHGEGVQHYRKNKKPRGRLQF